VEGLKLVRGEGGGGIKTAWRRGRRRD